MQSGLCTHGTGYDISPGPLATLYLGGGSYDPSRKDVFTLI